MNVNGMNGPAGNGFFGNTEFSDSSVATVQSGETTLAQIAGRLNVPVELLIQANPHIQDLNSLSAGQDIHLPQMPAPPAPGASPEFAAPAGPVETGRGFDRDLGSDVARARFQGGMSGNPVLAFGSQTVVYAGTSSATKAASAAGGSQFAGMFLGTTGDGVDVKVTREIGSTQGYDQRFQAVAVARLGGAEPAAVIQDNNGKWHAVETNANFAGGGFIAANSPTRAVDPLFSSKSIADQRQVVASLQAKVQSLDAAKAQGGDSKPTADQIDDASADLAHARLVLASLIFGVPESEIKINGSSFNREPGKINLNPNLPDPGRHGYVGTDQGEDFHPGMPSAFEIRSDQLDKPADAYGVMFHEVSHLGDYDLTQKWVDKYQQEGHIFVSGAPGEAAFTKWMAAQVPKGISAADAELVTEVAEDHHAATEARSYTHTFLAALQAGAPDVAANQLSTYTWAMKAGKCDVPRSHSAVVAALTQEMQSAYRQMPKDMQQQFAAALTAAQKANPGTWISDIKLPK